MTLAISSLQVFVTHNRIFADVARPEGASMRARRLRWDMDCSGKPPIASRQYEQIQKRRRFRIKQEKVRLLYFLSNLKKSLNQ